MRIEKILKIAAFMIILAGVSFGSWVGYVWPRQSPEFEFAVYVFNMPLFILILIVSSVMCLLFLGLSEIISLLNKINEKIGCNL